MIERGDTNYAGYVPDLPVCFTVGDSPDEVEDNLREAIAEHLQALRDYGKPIPEPSFSPQAGTQAEARLISIAV